MATKKTKKATRKAPAAPARTVHVAAGNLSDLVSIIANELEKRRGVQTLRDPGVPASTRDDRPNIPPPGGNAVALAPPSVAELVKSNRLRTEGLLGRLNSLESILREMPPAGADLAQSPTPPGLNGVLGLTSNYIDDAHDAVTRISKYLGIDV